MDRRPRLATDLQTLLFSRMANNFADQLILFVMPMIVYQATSSVTLSAFTFAIEWVPRLIALPLSGVLADRLGSKTLYLSSDAARFVLCCVLAIYTHFMAPSFLVLGVLGGLVGFFHEQAFVALETSVPILATEGQISKVQSYLQAIEHGFQILGPVAAGVLLTTTSSQVIFLIAGGLFAISLINALRLNIKAPNVPGTVSSIFEDLQIGMVSLLQNCRLLGLSTATFYLNLLLGGALAVSCGYIQSEFGRSAGDYATLMTTAGIAALISFGILPLALRSCTLNSIGWVSFAGTIAAGFGLGIARDFRPYLVSVTVLIVCDGIFNVFIRTLRVRYIHRDQFGKVIGFAILFNLSAIPTGALLVSLCSTFFSVPVFFLATSALGALALSLTAIKGGQLETGEKPRSSHELKVDVRQPQHG